MTRGSLPIRQTQCLKNPSKVWILTQMERMQMYSFGPIWSPIYCRKTKILLKTKISGKLSSLGISNKISPRSQKKSHNSCKINQNKLFGPKLGINCSLRPRQKIICWGPNWPSFIFWIFVEDPIGPIFLFFILFYFILFLFLGVWGGEGGLGTITSVNNVRLSGSFVRR